MPVSIGTDKSRIPVTSLIPSMIACPSQPPANEPALGVTAGLPLSSGLFSLLPGNRHITLSPKRSL